MRVLALGLVLVMLVFSGCFLFQEEVVANNTTAPPPPPPPPKVPTVTIAGPSSGEVVLIPIGSETAEVTLSITTQNLILKAPGGAKKVGEGHFRVTVDDNVPVTVTSKTYQIPGLAEGQHTIKVELLHNDRSQYSPAISKTAVFAVEAEKPLEYVPVDYTVAITGSGYDPASLTVKVGDRVTWVNDGQMPQTATCFVGGRKVFDTGSIASGKSVTIAMTEIVECEYYSQLFRALTGTLMVESNGTQ
ncbi:MAG: hypothetical protein AB1324_02750 [Candidatus Micrarchaeota archaeon]